MALANFIKERKQKNRKSLLVDNMVFCNGSLISVPSTKSEEYLDVKLNDFQQTTHYETQYYENKDLLSINNQLNEETKCLVKKYNCDLCDTENTDNFIILPCGHIFHIKCLADTHLINGIIDEEFLSTRVCLVCNIPIEIEDLLYIHNKFYRNTKEYITKHQENVDKLNKEMTKIKDELRICYESQQKLELQRSKCKQITVTINTLSTHF